MKTLTEAEIRQALCSLHGWELTQMQGRPALRKTFDTGDFLAGLAFVTRIAVLAEKANHHPDVLLTYPKVTLHLTTHDAGGITDRDIELARSVDALS